MFIDLVKIKIKAGDGGNGLVSFRREKFVDRGGPDGGNGGRGGSVIFKACQSEYDLTKFRFLKLIEAEAGQPGGRSNKTGKSGADIVHNLPCGTVVSDPESGEVIADLVEPDSTVVLARGGVGGFGNAHFKSSVRQAPLLAEKGLKGEEKIIKCELKLLAEVGLVGLPNAGKSTFLQTVSAARPKIAAYPFTTLQPHLGVSRNGCLIADIPGLIAGAAEGKGLGHQFLRHIERNLITLHLIDCQNEDLAESYLQVAAELEAYSPAILQRPQLVALTKMETLDEQVLGQKLKILRKTIPRTSKIYTISSHLGLNIDTLLADLKKLIVSERRRESAKPADKQAGLAIFKLDNLNTKFTVERMSETRFRVTGRKIETFALKTNLDNFHGRQRLLDIMSKMGITRRLLALGYRDELVVFGRDQIGSLKLVETEIRGKQKTVLLKTKTKGARRR